MIDIGLIKHRPSVVTIDEVTKAPNQILMGVLGPDRIAHGDPAPSFIGIHDKTAALRVHQNRLVLQQGEVGIGPRALLDYGQGFWSAGLKHRWRARRPQHIYDDEDQGACHRRYSCAQRPRCICGEGERPPQRITVLGVLVGEPAKPHHRQQ